MIPKLIEAGIVFLIRWAMDEQIETVYMVAIDCLASLVAPKHDEVSLIDGFINEIRIERKRSYSKS